MGAMQTERMSGLLGLVRGIVTGLGRRAAWRVTVLGVLLALVDAGLAGDGLHYKTDRETLRDDETLQLLEEHKLVSKYSANVKGGGVELILRH